MNLKNINSLCDPNESEEIYCYSGYFIKTTVEELKDWLGIEFNKSSDIINRKKKQTTQYILERLKEHVDKLQIGNIYSFQFFINRQTSSFYKLDDRLTNIVGKYVKKTSKIIRDYTFHLDYWKDLFFNDEFISVYELGKNEKLLHYSFTETKFDEKSKISLEDFAEINKTYKAYFFIINKDNRKSKHIDKLKTVAPWIELEKGKTMHERLLKTLEKMNLQNEVKKLSDQWAGMERNPDLYIFGNDILKAIKSYEVKEVYCYDEFKGKIEKNMNAEFMNFAWHVFKKDNAKNYDDIKKLEDYKGIFGVRYFAI